MRRHKKSRKKTPLRPSGRRKKNLFFLNGTAFRIGNVRIYKLYSCEKVLYVLEPLEGVPLPPGYTVLVLLYLKVRVASRFLLQNNLALWSLTTQKKM